MSECIVETRYGKVQGYQQGAICVWKGIPFARPPVGARRFRPPEPPESWTGVRPTTAFSPMAPQVAEMGASMVGAIGAERVVDPRPISEDCLYLNIWSPAADQGKRPVMVYIHGGAFTIGSASDPWYDGTSFAERHNIVVVSLNYRLGILGFVYLKELAGAGSSYSGNCGLLDQIAALRWVRENIAAFGGDPENVTVMGESAGAMSIAALLGMPAARGLFKRAILQSGAAGDLPTGAEATRVAQALLSKLGLDPSQVEALAEVPLEALLKVQPELGQEFGGVRAFSPVIDGETLPRHPLEMLAQGLARDVAVLVGTNRDEWRLFALMGGGAQINEALLRRLFGDAAQQVLARYIAAREDHSPELAWIDLMGDLVFRIPAIRLAEAQVRQGAPVWMYRFDWKSPAFGGALGAAHAMDIPFVFNTLDVGLSRLFTGTAPSRQTLADLMHAAWAAFIRDGNPQLPGLPAWPRYDLERRATLIWDETPSLAEDPQGELRALWEGVRLPGPA
ncbi:carboxylesterase/lipase family protein [Thermogemmatispora sp.]|uniref:carboxylesterase/lipase family protein n=1 Tax=Thermogemmatispora sp. TaxID=1968838 RepID=UPI001D9139F1|nr:carboxylesterase/lipase family protein [Thermogemmatispora sp.]MBX5450937.1 carboxylesterase/lipase family protein [Thermogemmatispora sp.]